MKLIEVDRLKEVFSKNVANGDAFEQLIDAQPTVDTEPVKHGSWKPFDEDEYTCSECGNIFVTIDGDHPLSHGFKYCPFCGAKMDERKEE